MCSGCLLLLCSFPLFIVVVRILHFYVMKIFLLNNLKWFPVSLVVYSQSYHPIILPLYWLAWFSLRLCRFAWGFVLLCSLNPRNCCAFCHVFLLRFHVEVFDILGMDDLFKECPGICESRNRINMNVETCFFLKVILFPVTKHFPHVCF